MTEREARLFGQLEKEYKRRFGKGFFVLAVGNETRTPLEILKSCIEKNEPYNVENIEPGKLN